MAKTNKPGNIVNLYWVTTDDHDEDWFILARTGRTAESYHIQYEGYEPGDTRAEAEGPKTAFGSHPCRNCSISYERIARCHGTLGKFWEPRGTQGREGHSQERPVTKRGVVQLVRTPACHGTARRYGREGEGIGGNRKESDDRW